ncbi:MAG: septum formation initiator family protein [Syntrophales bacterium]|nr:septum formation initiator family protein [Syntrophales bacterium]MDD5641291.1 septum formation initiator family protein [Syntrophales bacterium]
MTGAPAQDGTQKVKKNRRFLMGVAAFVGLALAFLVVFSHQGLYRIYRLRQERQAVEQENARLMAENTRLARTIDRLQHDPEMIQDLIRRELNFVKKNEIIVQFPPKPGKNAAPHLRAGPPHHRPGAGDQYDRPRRVPGPPQRAP